VQRAGETALTAHSQDVEAQFANGAAESDRGEHRVRRLYIEAEGVYVRLQRQAKQHRELRT